MSPERFADALNYLDDDLIQQTDDLRQGRRVLHTRPRLQQVIRWAAPAACLVLLLGVGSRILPVAETGGSADGSAFEEAQIEQNRSPAVAVQDQSTGDIEKANYGSTAGWQSVSAADISLSIPADWEYELEPGEDDSLFVAIRPAGELGELKIGYMPNFGVCGTGLTEEEITIAGMKALAGYYDGGSRWSFIAFPETDYVILKDGADTWWGDHAKTVDQILETIVFEK